MKSSSTNAKASPKSVKPIIDPKIKELSNKLLLAAERGIALEVESLIDQGALINSRNIEGNTALHLAGKGGHKKTIEILLKKGANYKLKNKKGFTAQELAADRDMEIKEINKELDEMGNTALHIAAMNNSPEISKLIAKGARVETVNKDGNTALHLFAMNSHSIDFTSASLLGKNNFLIGAQNKDGNTPLHLVLMGNDILAFLNMIGYAGDYLGYSQVVNAPNKQDNTPLHLATASINHQVSEELGQVISSYNKVDAINQDGNTALHLAAKNGHNYMYQRLIAIGADTQIKNKDGHTAEQLAKINGHAEILEFESVKEKVTIPEFIQGYRNIHKNPVPIITDKEDEQIRSDMQNKLREAIHQLDSNSNNNGQALIHTDTHMTDANEEAQIQLAMRDSIDEANVRAAKEENAKAQTALNNFRQDLLERRFERADKILSESIANLHEFQKYTKVIDEFKGNANRAEYSDMIRNIASLECNNILKAAIGTESENLIDISKILGKSITSNKTNTRISVKGLLENLSIEIKTLPNKETFKPVKMEDIKFEEDVIASLKSAEIKKDINVEKKREFSTDQSIINKSKNTGRYR